MCQDLHGFEISLTGAMRKEEWQKYRKARIMWAIHYNGEAPTSMKPSIFPLNEAGQLVPVGVSLREQSQVAYHRGGGSHS